MYLQLKMILYESKKAGTLCQTDYISVLAQASLNIHLFTFEKRQC